MVIVVYIFFGILLLVLLNQISYAIWSLSIIKGIRILCSEILFELRIVWVTRKISKCHIYERLRRTIALIKLDKKYRKYDFYIKETQRERLHYEEQVRKFSEK